MTTGIPATLQAVQASWRAVEIPAVLITANCWPPACCCSSCPSAMRSTRAATMCPGEAAWPGRLADDHVRDVRARAAARGGAAGRRPGGVAATRGSAGPGRARVPRSVLPPQAWAAAGPATAGGLLAVVLAARRTLRRPVVEEWRRSGRKPAGRGWIADAVLATAAVAGLLELAVSGQIGSARHGALGLLVPGLLGLAIAVIASRRCRWPAGRPSPGPAPGAVSACSSRSGMSPGARAEPGPRSCSRPRSR